MLARCGVDPKEAANTMIVGKLFFFKAQLLHKLKADGTSVEIGIQYSVKGNKQFFFYIGVLSAGLVLSSLMSLLILSKCNKNKEEEAEEED
jgi:hypothetical protein